MAEIDARMRSGLGAPKMVTVSGFAQWDTLKVESIEVLDETATGFTLKVVMQNAVESVNEFSGSVEMFYGPKNAKLYFGVQSGSAKALANVSNVEVVSGKTQFQIDARMRSGF